MTLSEEINEELEYLNSVNTRPCSKLIVDKELHKELAKENDLVQDGKYGQLDMEVLDGNEVLRWKLI